MIGGSGVAKIEYYTGIVKIDGFTFTMTNENQIRLSSDPMLDCPDKPMDNFSTKRFQAGEKIDIEIDITFDDWDATVSDTLARSCQTFLKELYNHRGTIKITPHIDKAQTYWVLRQYSWRHSNAYGKWLGIVMTLHFKGSEKIDSLDIVE